MMHDPKALIASQQPKSLLQELKDKRFSRQNIRFFIKREDLIHNMISGNKWRKLTYNIRHILSQNYVGLVTFGGAYSNHIAASAAAGKAFGIATVGMIRGEETLPLNATLRFALECGMTLHYISRTEYRKRYDSIFLENMKRCFPGFYIIPEGGANHLGIEGCKAILHERESWDIVAVSCGTGSTMAGLIHSVSDDTLVLGFPALKNSEDISQKISLWCPGRYQWRIECGYHFGGFARYSKVLCEFICDFKRRFNIQLDPLYTGKLFFGIMDMIDKGIFKAGSRIVAIHTGGLQGIHGFETRYGESLTG